MAKDAQLSKLIPEFRRNAERVVPMQLASAIPGGGEYEILIHSRLVSRMIKATYRADELRELRKLLRSVTLIELSERGFVRAADRLFDGNEDPTHYDAIWIRDSLWVYLGLRSLPDRSGDAKRVLKRMLDYVSTSAQRARLKNSRTLHIRFDSRSPSFRDVQVNGRPQPWNHNQNDALGLLLDFVLRAFDEGVFAPSDMTNENWQAIALLPAYFARIRFHAAEDSGSWEEIERVNTSSVALVTSGLESLRQLMKSSLPQNREAFRHIKSAALELGIARFISPKQMESQVRLGYARVRKQLRSGGESPDYPEHDPRFRREDAALLNVIYPARLQKLSINDKIRALSAVKSLVGRAGIRRYRGDSYQAGNFWFAQGPGIATTSMTAATRSAKEFVARALNFVPESEAQWFFDSWYSVAAGALFLETGDPRFRAEQFQFLNRALGQITGERNSVGADGKRVPPCALPESYNSIIFGDAQYFAPSPITPLNWAKASLLLAISSIEQSLS